MGGVIVQYLLRYTLGYVVNLEIAAVDSVVNLEIVADDGVSDVCGVDCVCKKVRGDVAWCVAAWCGGVVR